MAANANHARELFLHAVGQLPSDRWDQYLTEACGGDALLQQEVQRMLRVHLEAGSFLDRPAVVPTATNDYPVTNENAGTTIGRYKLLELIGEGGMGAVWMAQQTEPIKRIVALKVIKAGMDTKQVLARFEAERQALALMDHPNIAKVLDGGTTGEPGRVSAGSAPATPTPGADATGLARPYFVMELVKGIPITRYCDEHHLTPRQRLELFIPVCQAIQHAHQKGIIHRDIKPSNVLIAQYDDRPVPKVIDFGVAKATGRQLTEETLHTSFGAVVGTIEYMSPEQATFNQLDVDTRSDIYSLGVLLYELLAGSPPFTKKDLEKAGMMEMLRLIREQEPSKPSTKLSTADGLPALAAKRGTEPAKLTKLVRGELDWIVMKALEKDRARRYETANGFAMDVQRYLADEQVLACPPSAGYRLRKFARRNRRALITAALLGTMLLVLAGSFGWMARDRAAQRGRNAEAVVILLDQCEEALRADQADRAALALEAAERRAGDGGAEELDGRLARCRADLRLLHELDEIDTFRWTWAGTSRPDREAVVARWRAALAGYGLTADEGRAAEVAGRISGSPLKDRVLAVLDWWVAAEPSGGLQTLLRTVDPDSFRGAVRNAVAANDPKRVAELARQPEALAQPARFAAVLGDLGGYPEERARAILESALQARPGDLTLLMTLTESYPINQAEGASERVRWLQAALAVHPENSAVRNSLGIALLDQGKPEEASVQFREAARLNPSNAFVRTNLGNAILVKGDLVGALVEFHEAVRLDPNDANAHNSLGKGLYEKGDMEGAITALKEAVRLDPTDATFRSNLGGFLSKNGESVGAIAELREAIRLNPKYSGARNNLAVALKETGDLEGSIAELREAIRLDPADAAAHINLGIILQKTGDLDGAIAKLREAVRLAPKDARWRDRLGLALQDKGDLAGAIAEYREATRLDPTYALAHGNLGSALLDKGDVDGALTALKEAVRLAPKDARSFRRIGRALHGKGNLDGAIGAYREAVRLRPKHAATRTKLGNLLHENGDLDGAIVEHREAILLDPKDADAHNELGRALMEKRDFKGAVVALKEAVRLDPTNATSHSNLGGALWKNGDLNAAIVELREAVRLDPKDAHAHNNLGGALCDGKRDYDGAILAFKEAIRLDPKYASAHFNLGNALSKKGNLEGTIAAYREAARLDPKDAHAHNAAAWLLAVSPDGLRNGRQSVVHATRACDLTKWKEPGHLDTLAAAYAEVGDFDRAIEFQTKALAFPDFKRKHGKESRERIQLYERKQPYRDPAFASPREVGPPPRRVKP